MKGSQAIVSGVGAVMPFPLQIGKELQDGFRGYLFDGDQGGFSCLFLLQKLDQDLYSIPITMNGMGADVLLPYEIIEKKGFRKRERLSSVFMMHLLIRFAKAHIKPLLGRF